MTLIILDDLLIVNDKTYAVAYRMRSSPAAARYFFVLALFVFALRALKRTTEKWGSTMLPQAKFDSNLLICYTESAFIKEQLYIS
jgi:hypothetical protein